ncbi:MAG: hypothetical protein RQ966_16935 [Acetobacteraceae bacterium]|nr:hypothetical protein [Acetobacteraceae bacterium]
MSKATGSAVCRPPPNLATINPFNFHAFLEDRSVAKRGRKSVASLSIVVTALPQRMAPPESLTEAQARVWRAVVEAKPVGYFDAPAGHLLAAFCGAVCSTDRLSEMIDALDLTAIADPRILRRFDRLLSIRERQTRLMTSLARCA